MIAVPDDMPVATPGPALIVATDGVPLAQIPPTAVSVNVVVDPAQIVVPLIGDGAVLTVIVLLTAQPPPSE